MTMTTAMMTMRTNPPAAPPAMAATGVVSSLLSLPLCSLFLPLDFCMLLPVFVTIVVVVVVAVVVVSDLAESQGSFYDQSNYSA